MAAARARCDAPCPIPRVQGPRAGKRASFTLKSIGEYEDTNPSAGCQVRNERKPREVQGELLIQSPRHPVPTFPHHHEPGNGSGRLPGSVRLQSRLAPPLPCRRTGVGIHWGDRSDIETGYSGVQAAALRPRALPARSLASPRPRSSLRASGSTARFAWILRNTGETSGPSRRPVGPRSMPCHETRPGCSSERP